MLTVYTNRTGFEYDIHSLVKAFYPGEEIKVTQDRETPGEISGGLPVLSVFFTETLIQCTVKSMITNTNLCLYPSAHDLANDVVKEVEIPENLQRTELKNRLKRLIYESLSEYLDKKLPWGTLTGIRPAKIAMAMLEEKEEEEAVLRRMKDTYLISGEKGKLALNIAKRERKLLSSLHYKDGYSLYIGIPFCPTTCLYCSFTSYPIGKYKKKVIDYLKALEKEMEAAAVLFSDKVLDTLYIGGGTPTTLEAEELELLLSAAARHFDLGFLQEYTVEAGRADSITEEKLRVLKKYGVSRISINPQTMKQETLKIIGRQHTVEQVVEAYQLARNVGFDNINMDIILGLPGESKEDVADTLKGIKKLYPDSLTVHSLAVKRASGLSQWIEENGISSMNNTEETMQMAAACGEEMGMKPYYLYRQKNMSGNFENVGYAAEGKYGIYNILIMEEKQSIAALGAGSISKRVYPDGRIERSDNVKDVDLYIERIDEMIERKDRLFQ